jgi:hypothetical protein
MRCVNQGPHSEQPLPVFAKDILQYLADHPGAADTVQGILQWWLHQTRVERGTREAQAALDVLVEKGWLTETEIPSPKIYRINEVQLAEIHEFLVSSAGDKK